MDDGKREKHIATWGCHVKTKVSITGILCRANGVQSSATLKGAYSDAARHFEHFYALTKSNEWYTNDGQNLVTLASDCLRRIYTTMAEEVHHHSSSVTFCFTGN